MRKDRRLRVFENRVLRRIFGTMRDEEELNYLYSSPNTIRVMKLRMRWVGHVARMGERESAYKILVGKLDGK
jgi:hypothetical protein